MAGCRQPLQRQPGPEFTSTEFTPTESAAAEATRRSTQTVAQQPASSPRLLGCPPDAPGCRELHRFAVIGDYGATTMDPAFWSPEPCPWAYPNCQWNGSAATSAAVAQTVASADPDFILAVGDHNYPDGEADRAGRNLLEANVGRLYADRFPDFYPTLGNHDYHCGACPAPYYAFFENRAWRDAESPSAFQYYRFERDGVEYFGLDSNWPHAAAGSEQHAWVASQVRESTACARVAFFHHPPYTAGPHSDDIWMRDWPWTSDGWDFDLVLGGHDHLYERVEIEGTRFMTAGTGGAPLYACGAPSNFNLASCLERHGALLVVVSTLDSGTEVPAAPGDLEIATAFVDVEGILHDQTAWSIECDDRD